VEKQQPGEEIHEPQLNNWRSESYETVSAITYQQLFLLCYADE
jgi:hypothetical protein